MSADGSTGVDGYSARSAAHGSILVARRADSHAASIRLTKIRKLLARQGVAITYATLHRFAVVELNFGRVATTIPVVDGAPGEELQVDTGWVGWLTLTGQKRRFRAWIFTAVRSRYRFVYPIRMVRN
jgi:hypothetical protein